MMNLQGLTLLLSILVLSSPSAAFNITRLFDNHPEFSTFNDLLSQTGVADAINSRRTITVLAVDNGAIGGITGKPPATIRNILATHVILDYYDKTKLSGLSKNTLLTTLFQTTGTADRMQGFVNVSKQSSGEVVFGSAVKGAESNSKLVKVVAAQPYNISVLQVSQPIIAPGIDQSAPLAIAPISAPSPASSEKAPKAAPSADSPDKEASDSPADSPDEEATEAPLAPEAEAPDTEAPASSPTPSPSPSPADDVADAEKPAEKASPPPNSAAGRLTVGAAAVTAAVGLVVALF